MHYSHCQTTQLMKEVDEIIDIKINFSNIEQKLLPSLIKVLQDAMDIANSLCKFNVKVYLISFYFQIHLHTHLLFKYIRRNRI